MNSVNPTGAFAVAPQAAQNTAGSSSSSSSSQQTPSNELTANSFITLLTAQLQAQDPLNPLDPNQMVNELTSMNTLQQIIQIRQDLDAILNNAQGVSSSPGSGSSKAAQGAAT